MLGREMGGFWVWGGGGGGGGRGLSVGWIWEREGGILRLGDGGKG